MIDITQLTIKKAHDGLVAKDFSVRELVDAYLKNIEEKNGEINAYLEVYDDIDSQVEAAQAKIDAGEGDTLTGIPIAVKDNILVKGRKAGAASKILEGFTAPYDAGVIEKLKASTPVFMGRTNMDEFAMGGSTENSAYGVTHNPYDTNRVAGGSSGGSAAAVAMDGALLALGTDTGGSVRQPASFCGTVGLKSTYGTISRSGVIAMGSSLDQVGLITKNAEDAEIVFKEISGHDLKDSTSLPDYSYPPRKSSSERTRGKFKIGVPRAFTDSDSIDEAVKQNFNESIEKLKKLGHTIVDIEIPHIEHALAVYYIIMPAEASTNVSRYDGVKFGLHVDGDNLLDDYLQSRAAGFGPEVKRRIILGSYVLSAGYADAYYNKAQDVRRMIRKDFEKVFEDVDLVLTPTAPTPAWKIGEKGDDPVATYLADIFTVVANLTGMPAISVPSGFIPSTHSTGSGKSGSGQAADLPLGIQFTAAHKDEGVLFAIGKDFETGV